MSDKPRHEKSTRELLLERRASVRFPCDVRASCRTGGDKTGVEWPATIKDVSRTGVGLILGRPFSAGIFLTVKLVRPDGQTLTVQAKVLHVRNDSAKWVHGCLLSEALTDHEWGELVK